MKTSEVIELEEKICRIQKDNADTERSLREAELSIKKLTSKLENSESVLKLNANNKKFMKQKAEVVNLEEFQNIQEKIEDLEDEVKYIHIQLSVLNKTRVNLQSSFNLNNTLLSKCQDKLKTFCKVLPLNG